MSNANSNSYKAGQLIQEEQPWEWTMSMENAADHCYFCMKNLQAASQPRMASNRCSGCRLAKYCSLECQKLDWKHSHKLVCAALKRLIDLNGVPCELTLLLLRFTAKLLHSPASVADFLQLTSPRFERLLEANRQHAELGKSIQVGWEKTLACLQLTEEQKKTATSHDVLASFTRIKHFATRIMGGELAPVGMGIYLKASTIEHSCAPNACLTYVGKRVRVMALENIENIDQVRVSYLDMLHPLKVRQALLKPYYIDCHCVLCADPARDAERFCMPCVNKNCGAKIPSDRRANLPCDKCAAKPDCNRQEDFDRVYQEVRLWVDSPLLYHGTVVDPAGVRRLEKKMLRVFHASNPVWPPFYVKQAGSMKRGFEAKFQQALESYRAFLSPLDPRIGWCLFCAADPDSRDRLAEFAKLEEASRVFSMMLGEDHEQAIKTRDTCRVVRANFALE